MNTRLGLFLVLIPALALSPVFAAPPPNQASSHPVGSVARFGDTLVARGSSKLEVVRSLGIAARELSADVWTYPNFHEDSVHRRDDDCSTLLIIFTKGRVSDLQLINARAEKLFAARLSANAPDKVQVAAK